MAVPLDAITRDTLQTYLIPTESVLPFPTLAEADERLFHGVTLPCADADGMYKVYRGGSFYGLARASGGTVKIEKKLC